MWCLWYAIFCFHETTSSSTKKVRVTHDSLSKLALSVYLAFSQRSSNFIAASRSRYVFWKLNEYTLYLRRYSMKTTSLYIIAEHFLVLLKSNIKHNSSKNKHNSWFCCRQKDNFSKAVSLAMLVTTPTSISLVKKRMLQVWNCAINCLHVAHRVSC